MLLYFLVCDSDCVVRVDSSTVLRTYTETHRQSATHLSFRIKKDGGQKKRMTFPLLRRPSAGFLDGKRNPIL